MGYQSDTVSTEVPVRLSRHNNEKDERHNALASELRSRLQTLTDALLSSGRYDEILTDKPERRVSNTNLAVTDDVRLKIVCDSGVLYDLPLRMTAIVATVNNGEIMPFIYDRHIPDEDNEYAPEIRQARLMIIDDGSFIL